MTAQVHLGHFPWFKLPRNELIPQLPNENPAHYEFFYQKCTILLLMLVQITCIFNVLITAINVDIHFYIRLVLN